MSRKTVLLLAIALCASAQVRLQEKENALGAQLASQVRKQTTSLNLPDVRAYVASLGRILAPYVPGAPRPWTFSVIVGNKGGSTCEPIALPGGYIFVPVQLILSARNEAEFAGMLAHAMAHVAQKQNLFTKASVSQVASIPLIFMDGALPGDNETGLPVSLLPTHRQHELDADLAAIRTMVAAGYDPHGLLDYISRTQPDVDPAYSSPPRKSERLQSLAAAIERTTSQRHMQSDTFTTIQQEIRTEQARLTPPHQVPSLGHPTK